MKTLRVLLLALLALAVVLVGSAPMGASPGTTELVSVDSAGVQGNDTSYNSAICDRSASANGNCDQPSDSSTETVDSAGDVGGSASIAVDAHGQPLISYWDRTNGDLKFATANVVPPPNDDFVDATVIDPLPEFPEWYSDEVDTSGATLEADEPGPCGDIGATVWYNYTAATSGWLAAETQGHWTSGMASDFDTVLAVYTGASLDELTVVGCNDDRAERQTSVVEFEATAGTTYYFQVSGFSAATGTLRLHLSDWCMPVPYATYSGDVVINGVPAPDGTSIPAVIDGTEWGRTSTSSGCYVLDVPSWLPGRPPCFWGGRIEFDADGLLCFPTVVWGGGPQQDVDLVCNTGDSDGDGFTDPVETHIGTDLQDTCPDVTGSPGLCPGKACDGDDCWPPDINVDTVVDTTDALLFLAAFPSAEGSPNYSHRLDLSPDWGVIDIFDALTFLLHFPSACTNP